MRGSRRLVALLLASAVPTLGGPARAESRADAAAPRVPGPRPAATPTADAAAPRPTGATAPATAPRASTSAPAASPSPAPSRARPFERQWLEPFFTKGPTAAAAERFRLEDWAGAAAGFDKALAQLPATAPERAPARFMLALARMNQGQWAEAGAIFESLAETYPLLGPYHAYYAARCRLRRGDTAGALAWVAKVPARSVPEAEAALIRLDALLAEQRFAELETEASRFLDRFPAGPRRAEAQFRRAEALERLGRAVPEAAELYRRIWAEAPGEGWAKRAEERLAALAQAARPDQAARLRTPTAAEWVTRGMGLFDRNQNAESEEAFTTALGAPGLDPALACKAHYHRAQSVFKQRQRPRAAPFFVEAEAACRTAGDRDLLVRSLYQGARCTASGGDRAGATAMYAKLEAEFPEHSYADDARLRAAELATDAGDEPAAAALLSELPDRYPAGDQAPEALWRLAFKAWQAGDLDRATHWLDENLRRFPREEIWYAEGRALYWKARVLDRQGKRAEARTYYGRAVKEYPLSVYALLALERLRTVAPDQRKAMVDELRGPMTGGTKEHVWQFAPREVFGEAGFLRAVELARLGQGSDARRELAKLGFAAPDSRDAARKAGARDEAREDVLWITAILLDRGRTWSASHAIPRYTVTGYRRGYPAGRGLAEWRISYPRAFPEVVLPASAENGVPAALQWAIMREESAFSPRIESFANALGLTQMLVRTAQRFSPGRVTRETLLDPGRNVALGSRFLAFLLQRFKGAAPLAIAGYNAGEAAVERWMRDRGGLELDEFMETIPYDETRNYTKRVLSSYFTYSWLYEPTAPVPELRLSLTEPQRAGRAAPRSPTRR
jgi:soluble lytic murein transglycosylase